MREKTEVLQRVVAGLAQGALLVGLTRRVPLEGGVTHQHVVRVLVDAHGRRHQFDLPVLAAFTATAAVDLTGLEVRQGGAVAHRVGEVLRNGEHVEREVLRESTVDELDGVAREVDLPRRGAVAREGPAPVAGAAVEAELSSVAGEPAVLDVEEQQVVDLPALVDRHVQQDVDALVELVEAQSARLVEFVAHRIHQVLVLLRDGEVGRGCRGDGLRVRGGFGLLLGDRFRLDRLRRGGGGRLGRLHLGDLGGRLFAAAVVAATGGQDKNEEDAEEDPAGGGAHGYSNLVFAGIEPAKHFEEMLLRLHTQHGNGRTIALSNYMWFTLQKRANLTRCIIPLMLKKINTPPLKKGMHKVIQN